MEHPAASFVMPPITPAQIVGELRQWGIAYLITSQDDAPSTRSMTAQQLLLALAQTPEARVRDAFVSLLLLHPILAENVLEAIATGDAYTAASLQTVILATLYEQRIWYPLLTMALGAPPQVPEMPFASLWQAWGLPPPWADFGLPGMYALAQYESARIGVPADYSGDWDNQIQHLVAQEWNRHPGTNGVRPMLIAPPWPTEQPNEEDAYMSWHRPPTSFLCRHRG